MSIFYKVSADWSLTRCEKAPTGGGEQRKGRQHSRNICCSFTARIHCHQGCHSISEGRTRVTYRETFGPLVKPSGGMGISALEPDLLLCIREVVKVIVNPQ